MATIITNEDVQQISCLARPEGRQKLLQCLHWKHFDEENESQKALQLDYLYDCLLFTVQHGFSWQQCCYLFTFAAEILDKTKGKSLTEAVCIYQRNAEHCLQHVSEKNLNAFTDFFFETFMKHYKLYQYVFSRKRDELKTVLRLQVDNPSETMSLKEGKSLPIWQYQEKINEIEKAELERKQARESEQVVAKANDDANLTVVYEEVQETDSPAERQVLEGLINKVATAHVTAMSHEISSKINTTMEDLEFMLEKTSLPRPQELGPPPRYGNKSTPNSGKRPKSQSQDKMKPRSSRAGNRVK